MARIQHLFILYPIATLPTAPIIHSTGALQCTTSAKIHNLINKVKNQMKAKSKTLQNTVIKYNNNKL